MMMLINIDNADLEMIKDLDASVDDLMERGESERAMEVHEQLRNLATRKVLIAIKMLDKANKRS